MQNEKVTLNWEKINSEATVSAEEATAGTGTPTTSDPGTETKDASGKITSRQLENKEEVTLLFAGDILLDDSYSPMIRLHARKNGILDCFSTETLQEMQKADVFMLNNEFPYTNRGTPTEGKKYTFRANPQNVKILNQLGVDIVSTANNHSYDYGEVSLLDTIDTLNQDEMPFAGSGANLTEASKPVIFQNDSTKIAFFSATQIERLDHPDTRGATNDSAGVFRCWQPDQLIAAVEKAKQDGCFVVTYIHWGTESTSKVDCYQTQLAQKLSTAGADLIIGDHPHVLQGIENVNGVPVIYSMANYWFNSGTCDTCLVKVTIKKNQIASYQFLPARQADCYTALLSGMDKDSVLNDMRSMSPGVTIDKDGLVTY